MMNKNILAILTFVLVIGVTACNGSDEADMSTNNSAITVAPVDDSIDWQAVSGKKIFFGHQSVGGNIIDGIKLVSRGAPEGARPSVIDVNDVSDEYQSYIAHAWIGENEDPESKITDFSRIIDNKLGDDIDIAFMKFCYVDFKVDSEEKVEDVFNNYRSSIEKLKSEHPGTTFIHVTAPLRTVESGVKAKVKRLLGRELGGYKNNILRNRFNRMLIDEYGGKDPVFDLARIEATKPDGSLEEFTSDGKSYLALSPEYTEDRGHLNDLGKKVVAEKLLIMLGKQGSDTEQ